MDKQELELKTLKLLEKSPNITQRSLSNELGISLGKTHYILRELIDVGCIKLENFRRSDNKIGYIYLLTPQGIQKKTEVTKRFLARKLIEYEKLKEKIDSAFQTKMERCIQEQVEATKKQEDATSKQSTDEVPVRDGSEASEKVSEENVEATVEELTGKEEEQTVQDEKPVVEEVTEEEQKEIFYVEILV